MSDKFYNEDPDELIPEDFLFKATTLLSKAIHHEFMMETNKKIKKESIKIIKLELLNQLKKFTPEKDELKHKQILCLKQYVEEDLLDSESAAKGDFPEDLEFHKVIEFIYFNVC